MEIVIIVLCSFFSFLGLLVTINWIIDKIIDYQVETESLEIIYYNLLSQGVPVIQTKKGFIKTARPIWRKITKIYMNKENK